MVNRVVMAGKLASPPKRVVNNGISFYLFTIATHSPDGQLVFPPVLTRALPKFLKFKEGAGLSDQMTVWVIGWVRTVDIDTSLAEEIRRLLRRSKNVRESNAIRQLRELLDSPEIQQVSIERVAVEVFADEIWPGGDYER